MDEFNDQDKFIALVDEKVKSHGYCSIVVSEGVAWPDGRFLAEQGTRDNFGHAQLGGAAPVVANLIKQELGYKFHWAVADHLQRSARHRASGLRGTVTGARAADSTDRPSGPRRAAAAVWL